MTNPYEPQSYGQQPGGFGQPSGGFQAQPGQMPGPAPGQQAPGAYGHPSGAFPAAPGQFPGQQPPFGGGAPGQPPFGGPPVAPQGLASWGQRAGAYLIDMAPPFVVILIGALVMLGSTTVGVIVMGIGYLGTFGWALYNRWIQGGNTGQSLGKRVVGIRLLGEQTGRPIGAGMAFVRDLAHALDGLACYIGFLWPLWDEKRQTFSDKVMSTLVVQSPAGPGGPGGGQQPGGFPAQPGGYPQQFAPQQPGGFPGQGGYPQQPQQPGGYPQQPGGFPQQPGGFGGQYPPQ
ncbi:Uncharacterized membrane protein YckC, RDD family [Amycolatopsis marina]|uniref:Uncharacterized membrane protein YckC, RDD family n=1 Tax=Amycolatopsis marina TaxID=490629 RepID=A0A1I0ZSY2_9PSEU|nr:RDD family protein [Amycolatopsis marina]SFB28206.1 Uncharacterized membrane protein YckC, RDD family [Amycolatopsis marina]